VFITAGPSTKMFTWGGGDMGGHVLRETTSRGLCGLVCPSLLLHHARETVTVSLGRGVLPICFFCRKERTTGVGGWGAGYSRMQNLFDFAACCSPSKATPLDLEKASPAGGQHPANRAYARMRARTGRGCEQERTMRRRQRERMHARALARVQPQVQRS
jgi:hypothetical protein